jgi:hypothetical protein
MFSIVLTVFTTGMTAVEFSGTNFDVTNVQKFPITTHPFEFQVSILEKRI